MSYEYFQSRIRPMFGLEVTAPENLSETYKKVTRKKTVMIFIIS